MKIKKVDDKPMVIHTKKKARIHTHEPKKAKIKGSNIYTVERAKKTARRTAVKAKVTDAKVKKANVAEAKKSYRKSTVHPIYQTAGKDKETSRFKRNIRESNVSIKTKQSNLHIAGRTGVVAAGAVNDQLEGGQEVSQAAYLAYEVSRPVTGTASRGAELFRRKAAAEAKKRIKIRKVEAGKQLSKRAVKKTAKDTAKTVAKETTKETAKTTAKATAKTAAKATAAAAGTAVAPGVGTAIGIAAGYEAGVAVEVKDTQITNRNRKIKFFLDKMKEQENQTDSVAKLVKDLVTKRVMLWIKTVAPVVGLVLLLLVLVVAMVAVPVVAVIAILYNSPFALFLPALESGDTVQSVTSAYVQEFNREVSTKANEHAKVIEVGATTDTAKSLQAQRMMTDEAAPKYQALDDALQKLMALNISLGNAKRAQLRTVMIAALTIIIIVIAVSTIYSNSLSVAISKSIEKPLNELKDRFITFAEGDIDSPLPTVESEDEIKELVSGVSAMSDRIRVIIKDSGRMLNEMSEGNFAIDTECEEVYTGAFTDLLTGIRKMNEEIDTTVRGVDDASGQVLTGSTNLAEAAQSLAEGATDQAASVEEMQATINELTSGIKTTAEELGTAYDEAYKYAEIAEGSRGDMEVLVQAMSRINETSEKIGAIITQIEDIASQTNLLSLNASIEAARAGEAGKGFAVVADQIRNLAEQSAKSAVDSKALIEAAIHEVGDGNMYAEKASTSLREVVDGIQAIADSAKKIKEISIEQADSMEQVEATAERIAEVVQNNSAAAQETSATSEELTAQATTLSGMVSVFKLRQ